MATKTQSHEEALPLCVFVTLWQEKMEAYCAEDRLVSPWRYTTPGSYFINNIVRVSTRPAASN